MTRLTVVDEIFLRGQRGLGTPSALQGIWRTEDPVDAPLLARIHAALRRGPLGRRVVRSRVPGARPSWRRNDSAHPLRIADEPLAGSDLLRWADAQGDELDPEFGPGWRLSAAALRAGGSVVVLTCSHALADGRGLALAVDHALSGAPVTEYAPPQSDWADARQQWATVLTGTARALRRGLPQPPDRAPGRGPATAPSSGAILQFPVAQWDRAAADRGGTANSFFLSMVSQLLWDSGFPGEQISASVPVDTRAERRVDNDMAMTQVCIDRTDTPATLRDKCRTAYEYRMSAPDGMPPELLQVLPERLAHRLSRGAGERAILCSNIGTLPAALTRLGPHSCSGVAARAIHPGLRTLPRTRVAAYLTRIGDSYTLALVSPGAEPAGSAPAASEPARAWLSGNGIECRVW